MKPLLSFVLLSFMLCGCGSSDSPGASAKGPKSDLVGYVLARDVKAGEKLEMGMLKPATIYSSTLKSGDIRDVMLTSADIKDFLGKPFKKDAKGDDFLEKELFQ